MQQGPFAPRALSRFRATTDLAATLSPSTDFLVSPVIRLPCSADFATGRGGLLQLLSMSLSPCCPYHPAGVTQRLGQSASCHAAFARHKKARPPDYFLSRPPVGSLALRPDDSLTTPRTALSVGFIRFVSSTHATQATGLLTLTPVGLPPAEHASLSWTHLCPKTRTRSVVESYGPCERRSIGTLPW